MGELSKAAAKLVDDQHANEVASLRAEVARERSRADSLAAEVAQLRRTEDLSAAVQSVKLSPPKWAKPTTKKSAAKRATACLLVSDVHYQEVVDPRQIGGIGAYSSDIAAQRMQRVFADGIKLAREYSGDLAFDGAVVALNGDLLTGVIHDELAETNDQPMFPALIGIAEILCAGIEQWADAFGSVLVPCEWGNHGRMGQKKKHKNAAGENFDWMVAQMVEAHFKNDPRVEVRHTLSPHLVFQVYGTRFLLTHGNHGVGSASGQGWGGAFVSIGRMLSKIRAQLSATGVEWDVALIGHWHTFHATAGLIANGTPKGPDEWSTQMGFVPEEPSQTLFLVTPEHGVTDVRRVFCADRAAEGW